jgi:DNA replication protein DnaC
MINIVLFGKKGAGKHYLLEKLNTFITEKKLDLEVEGEILSLPEIVVVLKENEENVIFPIYVGSSDKTCLLRVLHETPEEVDVPAAIEEAIEEIDNFKSYFATTDFTFNVIDNNDNSDNAEKELSNLLNRIVE